MLYAKKRGFPFIILHDIIDSSTETNGLSAYKECWKSMGKLKKNYTHFHLNNHQVFSFSVPFKKMIYTE